VGRAVEIDDLIQAGMVGLVEAGNRSHQVPDEEFSIYASQRIRGAMIDFVRRHAQLSRVVVQRKSSCARPVAACSNPNSANLPRLKWPAT